MSIDFSKIFTEAAKSAGVELKASPAEVTSYANTRVAYLQTIQGQAGFDEAVQAEALAVVIFAAAKTVNVADAADAKVIGGAFTLLLAALA